MMNLLVFSLFFYCINVLAWNEDMTRNQQCDGMAETIEKYMDYYGISLLNVRESIKYLGPSIRLRKVLAKAMRGEDIHSVILGGSVSCKHVQ